MRQLKFFLVVRDSVINGSQQILERAGSTPLHTYEVMIAGVGVLFAWCLSTFLIGEHLTGYNKPEEQKWIIGCIFMVPLYAVCSFLSLWKTSLDLVSNLIRNCYEAYTIYSFCLYLVACLGGEERTVEKMSGKASSGLPGPHTPLIDNRTSNEGLRVQQSEVIMDLPKVTMEHPPPLNFFLQPWVPGPQMYASIKFGVVQYMVLKCIAAIAQLVLDPYRLYGEGDFNWNTGYPYVALVLNFSQCWAIYCLIMFYQATYQYLQPIRPLGKFLAIKSIIFVTWWQGIIIALAGATKMVNYAAEDVNRTQDFLVAVEMAFMAVAYLYVFPATPYQRMSPAERVVTHHVAVLADLASVGAPPNPDEVMASENTGCLRFLNTGGREAVTSFTASIQDVLFGGGETMLKDVRETVHQAVEPVEKGFSKVNLGFQDTLDLIHNKLAWGGLRRPPGNQEVRDDSFLPDRPTGSDRALRHSGPLDRGVLMPSGLLDARDGESVSDSGLAPEGRRSRRGGVAKTHSYGSLEGIADAAGAVNPGPSFSGDQKPAGKGGGLSGGGKLPPRAR